MFDENLFFKCFAISVPRAVTVVDNFTSQDAKSPKLLSLYLPDLKPRFNQILL